MNQRGFTLVEVLIATIILATGLVMVIEGMGRTQDALRISRNLVLASQVAETQIMASEMEVLNYGQLRSSSDKKTVKFPGREFVWVKSVRPYTDASLEGETDLNEVDVQVHWHEGNRNNVLRLTTLIANEKEEKTL